MLVTVLYSSPTAVLFQVLLSGRYCQRALGAERPARILPEESDAIQSIGDGRVEMSIDVHAAADPLERNSDPFARAQSPEGDERSALTATIPGGPFTGSQTGSTFGDGRLGGSKPKSRMHPTPGSASNRRRQKRGTLLIVRSHPECAKCGLQFFRG
jgi:hypothetical protein